MIENDDVLIYLSQIKGVGRWTVEMLLMFALGREDVFAIDDLGIQNAMNKLYKLDRADKKKFREDMLRISEKSWLACSVLAAKPIAPLLLAPALAARVFLTPCRRVVFILACASDFRGESKDQCSSGAMALVNLRFRNTRLIAIVALPTL